MSARARTGLRLVTAGVGGWTLLTVVLCVRANIPEMPLSIAFGLYATWSMGSFGMAFTMIGLSVWVTTWPEGGFGESNDSKARAPREDTVVPWHPPRRDHDPEVRTCSVTSVFSAEDDAVAQSRSMLSTANEVSFELGEKIKTHMRGLSKKYAPGGDVNAYYPQVFISYATGMRLGTDGKGCGPGMEYAKMLADKLDNLGVGCFSGLHVEAGRDWREYLEKLSSDFSKAKVLLVVVTPAIFKSFPSMKEIGAALEKRLRIYPLIFEPTSTCEWNMAIFLKPTSPPNDKRMFTKVQNEYAA